MFEFEFVLNIRNEFAFNKGVNNNLTLNQRTVYN
jgi:hypothetical protein